MINDRTIRASFIAAPVFLILYGIARLLDGLDGNYGPGIAWTVGHIMFLLGLLTFGLVIIGLYQRVDGGTSRRRFISGLAAILGLIGLLVFVRVALIDIITGLRATDHTAMRVISNQLNAYPNAMLLPASNLGPLFFQVGLLILMLQLAILTPRQIPWWSPVTLLLGFLMLGFNLNLLLPGAILIGVALLPLSLTHKVSDS